MRDPRTGRFERIDRDLALLFRNIRPDLRAMVLAMRVDNHATHAGTEVKKYIGENEREIILNIYKRDFEEFSYSGILKFRNIVDRIRWRKLPKGGIEMDVL